MFSRRYHQTKEDSKHLVRAGSKPADIPKPTGPKPAGPKADAPKAPAPALTVTVAKPSPDADIEEGEILIGNTLLSLKGKEVPGSSLAPSLDKEVETLEGLNVDETGRLRLFGFRKFWLISRLF